MEIRPSARKHGIDDADMLHAMTFSFLDVRQDAEHWMFIGPARDGITDLEVGVVVDARGQRIIHAMKARPKFTRRRWR